MDDIAPESTPGSVIEAPFVSEGLSVLPEWIDLNGHMNVAYYLKAFDLAFDRVYDRFGLDTEGLKAPNSSTFSAEIHLTYQRELLEGDPLRVTTQLLDFDAKRLHCMQCMYHAREGYLAATSEWLVLHMDMTQRRVAAMPEALQRHLARVRAAHAVLPAPPEVGRRIDLANRRAR